jgi:phthiocerol/phenolphthiocerol synthesis type-I polyketide synthase E
VRAEPAPEPAVEPIAVIGMAGRFPGARDVQALWDNLCQGRESIEDLSDEELAAQGVSPKLLADPAYVKRAATLDGFDEFDTEFFGFTPQAARTMDPQHRLLLQCSWHALEDAGHDPAGFPGPVGVFATCSTNLYFAYHLLSRHDVGEFAGAGAHAELLQLMAGTDVNTLATRVSHALDLRGPSLAVQTACSSGLVAVHLAAQSLLGGECDMALAGGLAVRVPHRVGYVYDPGSIVSPDGRCRAFDARAAGTVFGSGGGVVVLRRLADALAGGDHVRAVILGSAVNNDGSRKMGYTAPSVDGQAAVVAEALAAAGVDPATVGYVEAHGTGTALGDPVEVAALARAFGGRRPGGDRCAIGSIKSNIGHLEMPAGIAGLIKTVLALEHGLLPPTLHFERPNPELNLEAGPFRVQTRLEPWRCEGPRRAGVSSLGVGGTNAHVVLEQAPERPSSAPEPGPRALLLSARTADALAEAGNRLAARLRGRPAPHLADVAHTLAHGRRHLDHRRVVVAGDPELAAEALEAPRHPSGAAGEARGEPPPVAFLFPGQGAQHAGMGAGLYAAEPVFRRHAGECAARFSDLLGLDLLAAMLGDDDGALRGTAAAQAALFTVEHALAQVLLARGVRPAVMAGHSIGEYAAACLAGVLELDDAIRLVALRGTLMGRSEAGAMLAVRLVEREAVELLAGTGLELSAVNEPKGCVVGGPVAAVERLEAALAERSVGVRRLATAHAFHTAAMQEAADRFAEAVAGVRFGTPGIPMVSTTSGGWMAPEEARDPARWAAQIRVPVRFAGAVTALLGDPRLVVLEVGPGRSLTSMARRSPAWSSTHRALAAMRQATERADDGERLLLALGGLWTTGVEVDWTAGAGASDGVRVPLPGYPFERTRHWVESEYAAAPPERRPEPAAAAPGPRAPGADAPAGVLAGIWSELLGIETIAPGDNFFDLGGDSVVAIQVAARAGQAGLRMTPQDLFEHQSVAALAAAVGGPAAGVPTPDPWPPAGDVPLTPTQWRLLELEGVDTERFWSTPLVLETAPGVDAGLLREALAHLAGRHPALRLGVERRDGLWAQRLNAPGPVELLTRPTGEAGLGGVLAELRAGLAFDGRPLLRAALVEGGGGRPGRLALVLHHLLVDHASERILLEELTAVCGDLLAGREPALPPPTTPWPDWARRVAALAADPDVQAEAALWLAPERRDPGLRLVAAPASPAAVGLVVEELGEADTAALFALQRSRRLPMEEIVLAAAAMAFAEVTGRSRLLVDVEGHGRAVRMPGVDLARTVGWCTTLSPVLAGPLGGGPAAGLAAVRAGLGAVPRQGLGYGVLRYLHAPTAAALRAAPPAEVMVAYLGSTAPPAGEPLDAGDPVPACTGHALEVRCSVARGRLRAEWWHDANRLEAALVARLGRAGAGALRALGGLAAAARWSDLTRDEMRVLFATAEAPQEKP